MFQRDFRIQKLTKCSYQKTKTKTTFGAHEVGL